MAGDLNRATLIGRLGGDPEVRTTQSGARIVNFSMATSESWRDKASGERKERTQWHRVVIWNEGIGKIAEQYLKKGSKCLVEGMIETRKWQDQSGTDKYTTEIVIRAFDGKLLLLGGNGGGDDGRGSGNGGAGRQQASGRSGDLDDEIPF